MSEQTPAQLAVNEIMKVINYNVTATQANEIKKAIVRHMGDGRDKERMDWLQNSCPIEFWTFLHNETNIRSAIDAERNTERNAKTE